MAAALGGTQSLHTNSMDETLALPSEKAAQIALRTQQLLAYETGVANTIDPLAGSYYVEHLTSKLEEEAEAYFRKIEDLGGVIKAIDLGEELHEGALHLPVRAGPGINPPCADRVEFVDEDDTGLLFLGELEDLPDHPRPLADVLLNQLRPDDADEGGVRLSGNGLGRQRLSGAWGSV